jgi:hypothetical protein
MPSGEGSANREDDVQVHLDVVSVWEAYVDRLAVVCGGANHVRRGADLLRVVMAVATRR